MIKDKNFNCWGRIHWSASKLKSFGNDIVAVDIKPKEYWF